MRERQQEFSKNRSKLNALGGKFGGPSRNRTGVQGFAVLCVTTPPSGLGVGGRKCAAFDAKSSAAMFADPKIIAHGRGKPLGVACYVI